MEENKSFKIAFESSVADIISLRVLLEEGKLDEALEFAREAEKKHMQSLEFDNNETDGISAENQEINYSAEPSHDEIVEQAEAALEAAKATMYYPVAHGESQKLQELIEQKVDAEDEDPN